MGILDAFRRKREPDKGKKSRIQMVTTSGEHYYEWNGRLYESDVIRSCIRPQVKALGKLVAKHIIDAPGKELQVNPVTYMRFLLEEPNPYMTGQMLQEKVFTQLALNNNAFIAIFRDRNDIPCELYPVPCTLAEVKYDKNGFMYIQFTYRNGNTNAMYYDDIIHLRNDFNTNDVLGESPAKALTSMMELVGVMDQGMMKAIKNSGVVRWLLKFENSMRREDIKANVKDFAETYLATESETFGAAGVDAKANAIRIEPKDYVPNALQNDRVMERIYSFFNTNKAIIQSNYNEDEWNSYYESVLEPYVIQIGLEYTRKLFSRQERYEGNKIVFEASNLQYASLSTKLALMSMVDRGALTPNEWRKTMNLAPVEGGDKPIRRLDTQPVGGENDETD